MPHISVVIVTYNAEPWIRKNLQSLAESSLAAHVIVVDNASTDRTAEIIKTEFPSVELICKSRLNLGFGGGNNIGIARAIENGSSYTCFF